ncbi:Sphingomyelin phosphodiesterase, partial [Halocaridina rubra]
GEVLYVINNTDYGYATICGWLLDGSCQSTDLQNWTLPLPGNKPEPEHPEPQQPTPGTIRILHLSDLHVDLLYNEGSAAVCGHPLCCRNAFGLPGPGEDAAGYWGALSNCDIPLVTLENLIANAAAMNPDLV